MVFVKAGPGDTSDSVIRKFTKKVINEGLLLEFKGKNFIKSLPKSGKKPRKNWKED